MDTYYPLHLQIAINGFLNEFVCRFPERPLAFPGPVLSRMLGLIRGWKEDIYAESSWYGYRVTQELVSKFAEDHKHQ